jgi:ribosomal protein S18 acetylase RimI-like enzyme
MTPRAPTTPSSCRWAFAPVRPEWIPGLADELCRLDPWKTLGYAPQAFVRLITQTEPGVSTRAIVVEGNCLGLVIVREAWLLGPYLRILGILPVAQGSGIGGEVIDHLCDEARQSGARNFWACVSGFNRRAQGFYYRHGFTVVGTLDDLVIEGQDELLLRRRLRQSPPSRPPSQPNT